MKMSPLMALVAVGCSPTTDRVQLLPTARDPTPAAIPIQLFSVVLPRCPFAEVGLVTSRPRDFTSGAMVLEGLRNEARRLGGDAVIHVRFVGERVLSGTVIQFTTPDCQQ